METSGMAGADPVELALRFAAALGLGIILGLEREHAKTEASFAGVRTFGLLALAGGVAAHVGPALGEPWLGFGLFGAIAALIVVSYAVTARLGRLGVTTEISALLAFSLGFLCVRGHVVTASGIAVASGGVLALKGWLHRLAARIETADIEATLEFAIVSVIILPLVPDRSFGPPPFDVFNPYTIWLMVVLISGLNFASYVLVKMVSAERGIGLTGLLGGLVSSTAVTLGFSRRSRSEPANAPAFALGILAAWTVMFARVAVLIATVDRRLALAVLPTMAAFTLASLAVCGWLWQRRRASATAQASPGANPFELGEAIRFGLVFGVVTFAARAAQVYLGDAGLYLAGAVAGLTDVDAITLSMAQLARDHTETVRAAALTVAIAVASNTLFKTGMAAFLGGAELRRIVLPAAAAILLAGSVLAAVF